MKSLRQDIEALKSEVAKRQLVDRSINCLIVFDFSQGRVRRDAEEMRCVAMPVEKVRVPKANVRGGDGKTSKIRGGTAHQFVHLYHIGIPVI